MPLKSDDVNCDASLGGVYESCSEIAMAKIGDPAFASQAARGSIAPSDESMGGTTMTSGFFFRSMPCPQSSRSIVASIVCCSLIQLLIGAPYAANEIAASTPRSLRTGIRGLIVGILSAGIWAPMACVNAPTLISGRFRWHFLLSIPMTVCVSVGVAFIPVVGSTFGIAANVLVGLLLSFILINAMNSRFFATPEHKKLNQSVGPPLVAVGFLFFGSIMLYVALTRWYSSSAIGLFLPVAEATLKFGVLLVLNRSCCKHYYEPKADFLQRLALTHDTDAAKGASAADLQSAPPAPPLLGDIEAVFANIAAVTAVVVGNGTFAATIVEVLVTPDSQSWIVGIVASCVMEMFVETGLAQRIQMWALVRFKLQRLLHHAERTALDEVFLESGSDFAAPLLAFAIGCLRAATFGDARAIVWYDVSPVVVWLLLVQVGCGLVSAALVRALNRFCGLGAVVRRAYPPGHPLGVGEHRNFELRNYVFTLGMSCPLIYFAFVAFLGPEFVTGISRGFDPAQSDIWVQPLIVFTSVKTNTTG